MATHPIAAVLGTALLTFVLFCSAVLLWPVSALQITDQHKVLFFVPLPVGSECKTRSIHSVQRTPVEETYRIVDGFLWAWRSRVQSHNAGLPFAAPVPGRFYSDPPWMVLEGGRQRWQTLWYRVGTEELGHNELALFSDTWVPLYRFFPLNRICIQVVQESLVCAVRKRTGML